MDKALEAAARALAPHLQGGRDFDKMPKDRGQLREWARQGMCGIDDALQEDAVQAARAALAAAFRNVEVSEAVIEAGVKARGANCGKIYREQAPAIFKAMCLARADELEAGK